MEDNPAYGMPQRSYVIQQPSAENVYELVASGTVKKEYVRNVERPIVVQERSRARRSPRVCVAIGIVATTAVLALVVALVAVVLNPVLNSSQQVESLEMEVERLQLSLNETSNTIEEMRYQISTLQTNTQTQYDNLGQTVEEHTELLQKLSPIGSFSTPASSCSNISQDSPSGEYWIQNNNTSSPVQVYCDMNRSCCNTTGGWTRVANLNMTDPSQQCPTGFTLDNNRTTAPLLRTCAGPGAGCVSIIFSSHGIEYSSVCGRVLGYQESGPTAFYPYHMNSSITIDDNYIAGVSLTHGQSPRQHIWSFAAAVDENRANAASCPCSRTDTTYTGSVPSFVGQDYFCETGARPNWATGTFYFEDPLWDGQGCGSISTCCSFNNPPRFCKQLPQPTTDDIELRLCYAVDFTPKDILLEDAEIYVK